MHLMSVGDANPRRSATLSLMHWLFRAGRVPVFLGVAGLALAGAFMSNVRDEYDARTILTARGQEVSATVTEVTEYNRSKESLAVRAALADGRLIDVDFADSNQLGAKVGQPIHVTVDPDDIRTNMPTDQLNSGQSFASGLAATSGPFALFGIGCFVFAFIRTKKAGSRADP
ncbi:hypothetical protein GCM10009554_44790 [Kribbella koreensis]|uniref:DUF3592 domain-containing protein n=1 Tax=Kribbella koreensis TaxID=57909 RepID=A0ABN1QV15_9ACTN